MSRCWSPSCAGAWRPGSAGEPPPRADANRSASNSAREGDGPEPGVEQPLKVGGPPPVEGEVEQPEEVLEELPTDASDGHIDPALRPLARELAEPMPGQQVGDAVGGLEQIAATSPTSDASWIVT